MEAARSSETSVNVYRCYIRVKLLLRWNLCGKFRFKVCDSFINFSLRSLYNRIHRSSTNKRCDCLKTVIELLAKIFTLFTDYGTFGTCWQSMDFVV